MTDAPPPADDSTPVRRRRPRYSGAHPRRFEHKYKERDPARYPDTVAKVLASGKTPAGTHRPIMVAEILDVLAPKPGQVGADCTLGFGGHALELLKRVLPGGRLIGLDADPIELPKTEARVRALGFGPDAFTAVRSNFAGLAQALAGAGLDGVDFALADLGVSSMQLDDPARGFAAKHEGPLDMRMNPQRGEPASALLRRMKPRELELLLAENSDEPNARLLAERLAGQSFNTTTQLAGAIRDALPRLDRDASDVVVRRVFQALRIAINDEFSALETCLRHLPGCLNPSGRAAVLTFHSGEDRRVKKAFEAGLRSGLYERIAEEVVRPTPAERHANPRSAPAKLRWAIRGR